MSRTRDSKKKYEGRMRKLAREEEKKLAEQKIREEIEAKSWLIGAKDNSKEIEMENKRKARQEAKQYRRELEKNEVAKIENMKVKKI